MRQKVIALALIAILLLPATGSASGAPVVDALALAQRLIVMYNQLQQIQAAYRKIELAVKALESFAETGDFSDLNGLLGQIDQIFNVYAEIEDNLGYLKVGVDEVYRDTFPGYVSPAFSLPADYEIRVERAQQSLRLIMRAMNRLTWNNTHSALLLQEMVADSKDADSPQEEAEVANMISTLQVTEAQKSLQAQLLTANAVTVGFGSLIQDQAAATRARADWLASATVAAIPDASSAAGFTGVPSSLSSGGPIF